MVRGTRWRSNVESKYSLQRFIFVLFAHNAVSISPWRLAPQARFASLFSLCESPLLLTFSNFTCRVSSRKRYLFKWRFFGRRRRHVIAWFNMLIADEWEHSLDIRYMRYNPTYKNTKLPKSFNALLFALDIQPPLNKICDSAEILHNAFLSTKGNAAWVLHVTMESPFVLLPCK